MGERQFAVLATIAVAHIILQTTLLYVAFYNSRLVNLFTHAVFLLLTYQLSVRYFRVKKIIPFDKAVLITGCDSGFGNQLAKRLDSRGFHVFASCLFPKGNGAKDLQENCSHRLKVLPLDVTNDESVAAALDFVKKNLGSKIFWAVVNNAGVSKGSAFDFSTIKHFKDTMEVNAVGPLRVTKAFLPLLKNSKGRVVNVTSMLGQITFPHLCPYSMSKHAVTAFSQCLSMEMVAWGVRVISIEPETFQTPITEVRAYICRRKAEVEEIDESIVSSYGKEYFEQMDKCVKRFLAMTSSSKIDIVLDAMESAVILEYPDHVYKPRWSWHSKVISNVLEYVPFSLYEKLFVAASKVLQLPVPRDAKK